MNYSVERKEDRIVITQGAAWELRPYGVLLSTAIMLYFFFDDDSSPFIYLILATAILSLVALFDIRTAIVDFENRGIIVTERGVTKRSHSLHRFEDLVPGLFFLKSFNLLGLRFHSLNLKTVRGERIVIVRSIIGNTDREETLVAELNESIVKSLQSASAETAQNPEIT